MAGLDTSFSWRSVASTVVGATVGNAAGRGLGLDGGNLWSGVARSVVTGSSQSYFNQQWARGGKLDFVQLAMDSFGNALGNDIVGRMTPAATAAPVTLAKNGQRTMDMDGVNFLDAGVDTSMPDMRWIDDLNTSIATGSNLAVNANTLGYTATVSAASQTAVAGGYQNDPGMGTQMEITYNPNERTLPEVAVTASAKESGGGLLSWLRKPENISFVLDMVPVVGTLKSLYQAGAGRDLITGEAVNRWVEGAGIVASMIPGGKLGVKGIVGALPNNGVPDLVRTRAELRQLDTSGLTNAEKGVLGEARASLVYQRAGYTELDARLPSNNGFDGVFVKYGSDGNPLDIIINESKFTSTGRASLSNPNMGRQMSPSWMDANIQKMMNSSNPRVMENGYFLDLNRHIIRPKINVVNAQGVNGWSVLKPPQ